MAVGDVPNAPATPLAVVLLLENIHRQLSLLGAVAFPAGGVGVAVAGVPDLLCLGWGHLLPLVGSVQL